MKNFDQKIIIITGAGSGMGRSLAVQLAQLGATVLISDKNTAGLNETNRLIEAGKKGSSKTYLVDVGKKAEIDAFAIQVLEEFTYIDVLINNAGMVIGEATLNEVLPADFERLINVNLWGVIHHTKAFLDILITRPEAAIVNTSSILGLMGMPGQIPYCVSKYAIRGFTESLRLELAKTNVAVTCVHPGGVATNMAANAIHYKHKEQFVEQFNKVVLTSADKAAGIIIRAIQKKSRSVMIGPDAKLIRLMAQAAPNLLDGLVLKKKAEMERPLAN